MIPVLKELILQKELGIESQAPSDIKTDSSPKVSQKITQ